MLDMGGSTPSLSTKLYLSVGKSGNPLVLETRDRWIEATRSDQVIWRIDVIGSHAALRTPCRKALEFESLILHHLQFYGNRSSIVT